MRRSLFFYEALSFFIANVLLFLLHDAYKETEVFLLSFISAVNESVFEHIKITFFALLITYVIQYFTMKKKYTNYWFAKSIGLIVAPLSVMVLYYTYSGVLGYHVLWIDILIGVIAILIAQVICYYLLNHYTKPILSNSAWIMIIVVLVVFYSLLTYTPIKIDLFKDMTTGQYGT